MDYYFLTVVSYSVEQQNLNILDHMIYFYYHDS